LASVKQIIYLQNDFTAYMIGNIMYKLANRLQTQDASGLPKSLPGAPVPIPASKIGLDEFDTLNNENIDFCNRLRNADKSDPSQAFFVSENGSFKDFSPAITSFLCTDRAHEIFDGGAAKFNSLSLQHPKFRFPDRDKVLTNQECYNEAKSFYDYANIDGHRGSPHKL
jgi:hypothetical protein